MKRYKHQLSYWNLFTADMGQLVPIGLTEVLPGDTFQHSTSLVIRLSPMASPVMHPVTARVHHFYVPHRLIWEDAGGTGTFEDFMTGGDGYDAQTVPTILSSGDEKDILDYYGIPRVAGIAVSALPSTGYNLIWNEYYRDQDLAQERTPEDLTLANVAWEKDYFTSARPWPQKGPDVTLPVVGPAPVRSNANTGNWTDVSVDASQNVYVGTGSQAGHEMFADLTQAEAVKINEFRRAFALQRYQEARARYGSRYTEYLRYLGIKPSDARLDRPEYLGGGRVRVAISEVLQTAPEPTPGGGEFGVGDMFGHGIAAMRTNRYRRFFEEHGYVHTFVSVRPKTMYMQSIPRTWLRRTKEDFHQRELEHIGQQEVRVNEIYADAVSGDDVFGYQDRYREYREHESQVTGEFRDLLNYWHLARDLPSAPTLNESFIRCVPSKRIFNEQTKHSLWCMAQHRLVARRMVTRNAGGRIL